MKLLRILLVVLLLAGCKVSPPQRPAPPLNTPSGPTEPPVLHNCDDAKKYGIPTPIYTGSPYYRPELDDNENGIACQVLEGGGTIPTAPEGSPKK